ncbi:MAG: hypothetical protein H0W16_00695 [Actinobacteria bacterium]|nr:hypothetical protein [Actinomycetota bacterium]
MPAHHGWTVSNASRSPRREPPGKRHTTRRALALVVDARGDVIRLPRIGRPDTSGRDAA